MPPELENLDPAEDIKLLTEDVDDDKETTEEVTEIEEVKEEDKETPDEEVEEVKEDEEVKDEEEEEKKEDEVKEDDKEEEGKAPSFAKVRAKYPNFFKEFPEVAGALGRELEYKKVYPTLEAAKESQERLAFHTELEESVLSGKPGLLLARLHSTDEKALESFTTNFLPTLLKGNPPLYEKITLPILKNFLRYAEKEGTRHGSENLVKAVEWLADFAFDADGKIPEDEKVEEKKGEPSEERKQLNKLLMQKVQDFNSELFDTTHKELEGKVSLEIDPKKALPEVVREALVQKILVELSTEILKDPVHKANMNKLFEDAHKNQYSRQYLSQLKSAYLARAKKILPAIQKKHLEKALKEMGKTVKKVEKDSGIRKVGARTEEQKTKFAKGWSNDPKKLDPRKSDADLLAED